VSLVQAFELCVGSVNSLISSLELERRTVPSRCGEGGLTLGWRHAPSSRCWSRRLPSSQPRGAAGWRAPSMDRTPV